VEQKEAVDYQGMEQVAQGQFATLQAGLGIDL
jgi:hypothetical protein